MTDNFMAEDVNPVRALTADAAHSDSVAQAGGSAAGLRLHLITLGLAALGALDAAYLTWVKLSGVNAACGGIGDCEVVNNSAFASISGLPIAVLGLGAYAAIIALLLLERSRPALSEYTRLATFGVTLIGTLYSGWLTYVEVAILRAICPFCVASAIIITLLFLMSVHRMLEKVDNA